MTTRRRNSPAAGSVADLVHLDRYPIHDLAHPKTIKLIERMRADLARDGASCVRNFLDPEAVDAMAIEARELSPLAYRGPREASPYFFNYRPDVAATLPKDHPLNISSPRRLSQVAADLIPDDSLLRGLWLDQQLIEFFARVLNEDALYPAADRYQALNISVMPEDGCQQWHFDKSSCVITLLLQAPEGGGEFEFVPNIRSNEDENYEQVQAVLKGDHSAVQSVAPEAGTLMFFRGHYSLHRVTPVVGPRSRLQSILAYNPRPRVVGSIESSRLHYGDRVAAENADASADHVARSGPGDAA